MAKRRIAFLGISLFSVTPFLAIIVAWSALPLAAQEQPPAAGGVSAGESKFRVLRSTSGTKGKQEGGFFVIEDPRTIFYLPEDKQVIVYFEWEGPPGMHRCEALWKNPDGKIVAIGDFQFDAKENRFGGYWTMLMAEGVPTGVWSVEARVDGEAAGTYAFQVLNSARPADAVPTRRLLTPPEIYRKALAASVTIEQVSPDGDTMGRSSGFFVAETTVATAFSAIDGASLLRIALPNGREVESTEVLAWNRRQDWALVRVPASSTTTLERPKDEVPTVGQRCYTLEVAGEGSRVIAAADITGKYKPSGAGERLNLMLSFAKATHGAPLLNEHGEVVGIVGGSLIPGAESTRGPGFNYAGQLPLGGMRNVGGLAVPITLVPTPGPDTHATTLDELARSGQFVAPLTAAKHVRYGNLAHQVQESHGLPVPVDVRNEFSTRDGDVALLVSWDPKDKIKTTTTTRIYNIDNRLLGESKPTKINLKPGDSAFTTSKFPISKLPPGIYRVDQMLGTEPAWRAFFRITD